MAKYCVIPGQPPVRLDSTDGHIIIIGEHPRPIPEQFVARARAAGCLTEEELAGLVQRLSGGGAPSPSSISPNTPAGINSSEEDWPDPPLGVRSDSSERAEKIMAMVIEILNTGNPVELTDSGAPTVEALNDKLGFEVTSAERDAAYAAAKG